MIRGSAQVESVASEPRIGVYVCRCGGNISDVIDTEKVAETIKLVPGVRVSKVHSFMCSEPGQAMIAEDIKKEQLNRVVVASCSPFLHELTFRVAVRRGGLNPYLYEHVNIREQGSWAHHGDPEGATVKAIRLVAAAVHRLYHAEPLEQIRLPSHRRALVIGGGIAGLKAAVDLAAKGVGVVLVEREPELGGRVLGLARLFPTDDSGRAQIDRLVREVCNNPNIEVLTGTVIKGVSGFLGNYDIAVGPALAAGAAGVDVGGAKDKKLSVGAIIVATGHDYYRPSLGEYGFKRYTQVVTMPEFIDLLAGASGDGIQWNGQRIHRIGFMHCVGSRQIEGIHPPQGDGKVNDYCSRVCCTTVLHQAVHAKRRFPNLAVFDFHQDIRTYGRLHEDYYRRASEAGVIFFRFHGDDPPLVEEGVDGFPIQVRLKDWLTWGEEVVVPLDLLVLAVGMVARDNRELVNLLKLPTGADRFFQEVHPKLRPVETSVNGILLAGSAQAPMTIEETLASASAAASKAACLLAHDSVELEPFKARVDADKCIGCGLCFPECAYEGALVRTSVEREGKTVTLAKVNPGLCVGCGACVPVCPTRAIDLQGWTLNQFEAMVDGLLSAPLPSKEVTSESSSHGQTH
ncbi:MAG: CoB--CoM heterodisulfide reductase iron-sulfur subunit A family protein [Verrucomicrobia bacterium]|nr:CoB--CoM heterodisulfide reductase iron-sulfur subunit A family protein [Verrucomicrobiota bacterium]